MSIATLLIIPFTIILLGGGYYWLRLHAARGPGPGEAVSRRLLQQFEDSRTSPRVMRVMRGTGRKG